MSTQHLQPVIRGYDPEIMQVQEIQLAAPSSVNFPPHYECSPETDTPILLHTHWEYNVVVVGTTYERVLRILLTLEHLRLTDKTINVQAYLKAIDNMGKGVISLAHTFTTDCILTNTTSPNNPINGAGRLGFTNVVTLTFEHSNTRRLVFFLNEATSVQRYSNINAFSAMCGKPGH
ncbi:hypothetical protein MRX96_046667 [Rhipicephalus microplus]